MSESASIAIVSALRRVQTILEMSELDQKRDIQSRAGEQYAFAPACVRHPRLRHAAAPHAAFAGSAPVRSSCTTP